MMILWLIIGVDFLADACFEDADVSISALDLVLLSDTKDVPRGGYDLKSLGLDERLLRFNRSLIDVLESFEAGFFVAGGGDDNDMDDFLIPLVSVVEEDVDFLADEDLSRH